MLNPFDIVNKLLNASATPEPEPELPVVLTEIRFICPDCEEGHRIITNDDEAAAKFLYELIKAKADIKQVSIDGEDVTHEVVTTITGLVALENILRKMM